MEIRKARQPEDISLWGGAVILLSLMAAAVLPVSFALAEEVSTIVEPGDLIDAKGVSKFFDAEALSQLLAAEYESLGDRPNYITNAQMAQRRVKFLIQRTEEASYLDEQGCVRPFTDRHREGMYQQPASSFSEPLRGYHQTPLDLVDLAPEILVITVTASEPGVLSGELGTIVRFEVVEWLKKDLANDSLGEPAYYLASDIWLTLDGKLYCQRRNNASMPEKGEKMVLFGFRAKNLQKHFWTGNAFPLDGDVILPQSYYLMNDGPPVPLKALKESIQ